MGESICAVGMEMGMHECCMPMPLCDTEKMSIPMPANRQSMRRMVSQVSARLTIFMLNAFRMQQEKESWQRERRPEAHCDVRSMVDK